MNNWSYHLSHKLIIIRLYHVDIDASMIRQRVGVDIRRNCLKRDHLLVDQILNLVLEVDAVFCIMSNNVGWYAHLWSGLYNFEQVSTGLGLIKWIYPTAATCSYNIFCLLESTVKFLGVFFSNSGQGGYNCLVGRRHLLITSGISMGSLAFGIRICLVIWWWILVVCRGILVYWSLDLID